MSGAPFLVRNQRFGSKLGVEYKLEDSLWAGLTDHGCKTSMGTTAENLAEKYKISREDADKFSFESQQKWLNANKNGYFKEELVSVKVLERRKEIEMVQDEHPRENTTMESLAKLNAVFKKDGTVTAGTASVRFNFGP